MYPKYVETKTVVLERMRFAVQRAISSHLMDGFNGNINVQMFDDRILIKAIITSVQIELLGEHLERKTVKYPRDWKENCKQALYNWLHGSEFIGHWPWFGAYCRKRWPIMYTVVDIDVRALYPTMAIPEKGKLHITRLERMETF